MSAAIDYLNPDLPAGLPRVTMPRDRRDAGGARRLWPSRRRSRGVQDRDRALAGARLAAGRPRYRRRGRHDRRHVRQRMAGRHPLRPQRRRRRSLHPRVRRRSRARRPRPRARPQPHPALARELPSGRRPALLPARPEAVPGAARASRRRHRARGVRLLPLRRQPRPLHPSEHLARGRVRHCRARSASSTSRAPCTRACRSISRASSVACSKRRSNSALRGYERFWGRQLLRRVTLAPGAAPARRSSSPRHCARAPLEISPSSAATVSRSGRAARAASLRAPRASREVRRRGAAAAADDPRAAVAGEHGVVGHQLRRAVVVDVAVDELRDAGVALGDHRQAGCAARKPSTVRSRSEAPTPQLAPKASGGSAELGDAARPCRPGSGPSSSGRRCRSSSCSTRARRCARCRARRPRSSSRGRDRLDPEHVGAAGEQASRLLLEHLGRVLDGQRPERRHDLAGRPHRAGDHHRAPGGVGDLAGDRGGAAVELEDAALGLVQLRAGWRCRRSCWSG